VVVFKAVLEKNGAGTNVAVTIQNAVPALARYGTSI
jgi:hypothetical protein